MDANMVQVTAKQRSPKDLEKWEKYLQSKGHRTEIREEVIKGYNKSYVLFRGYTSEELDTPKKGYWRISPNGFERTSDLVRAGRRSI